MKRILLPRIELCFIMLGFLGFCIFYQDEYWNQFLWYCSDNGSYAGCFLPEREVVAEEESVEARDMDSERVDFPTSSDAGWTNDYVPVQDAPIPGTDEAEWSDGWK